jgi:hypothetical protein
MAMKCFKVVQRVLEDTYGLIPGTEPLRDAAITAAINGLSSSYGSVLTQGGPDFSDPVRRFAYVYSYVPAHAHWVYELLDMSPEAAAVFDADKVRVACVGGGPGSDLVGVLKFLDTHGKTPTLFCEIVDGCVQWKQTWSDIGYTLDLNGSLHTDYVIQVVGDPNIWSQPHKLNKADLLTLSFFVSEIVHLGQPAWAYVEAVLAMAKPGAILLFNENNNWSFYGPFDDLWRKTGWEVLVSGEGSRKVYDSGEKLDDLGTFKAKFNNRASKLTGNMAWRVLRKKAPGT